MAGVGVVEYLPCAATMCLHRDRLPEACVTIHGYNELRQNHARFFGFTIYPKKGTFWHSIPTLITQTSTLQFALSANIIYLFKLLFFKNLHMIVHKP